MPLPALALPLGLSLAGKGLSALFGGRSKKKQVKEQNRANTAGLNLQQKQREDSRRAQLALAQGLMSRESPTTGDGSIQTRGGALDPALFAQLDRERTYDFGSVMPGSVGGVDSFLSGLFGGAADVIPRMFGGQPSAAAGAVDGGAAGSDFAASPLTRPNVTIEDLQRLQNS